MKVQAAVFCVLVITSVGSTWGRTIIDVTSNDVEATCPYEAIPGTMFDVPYILLNAQHECYKPSATFLHQLDTSSTTEQYKRVFRKACVQVPEVTACIANVVKDAEICLHGEQLKMFMTVHNTVALGMQNVCGDDSEGVSRMYAQELKPLDFFRQLRVVGCVSGTALQSQYKQETNMVEYTMRRYQSITKGRQCISNIVEQVGKSAPNFQSLMESILSGMKCISPTTREVVLCRSLEATTQGNTELLED